MSSANGYSFLTGPISTWPAKINTSDTVNPGDMLYWDSGTKTNRPITDPTNGDLFSGVSLGSYPPTSNIDNGTLVQDPSVPSALGGLQSWFGTASETLTKGDPLYVGATAQTVVKAAPGGTDINDVIGYFWPDDGNDLAVTAGMRVQVRQRTNWPSTSLAA